MRALHSEFVKLFSTRLWLWLALTVVTLTGGLTFLIVNEVDEAGTEFGTTFSPDDVAQMLSLMAPIAYIIAACLGIIGLTGEYRHQTVTPTFLAVPRRPVVVFAKLVLYFLVGGACGVLFAGVLGVITFPMLGSKGYDISLGDDVVTDSLRGVVLVCALFALFGVGLGTLLRNQVFAVTGTVLYLFVIENILLAIPATRGAYPYLPGGAARTIMYENLDLGEGLDLLTSSQASLALATWALGLAVLGSLITISRDVT